MTAKTKLRGHAIDQTHYNRLRKKSVKKMGFNVNHFVFYFF